MDGANNGTTFTDSSANNFTITRLNTPVTSTAQSKFGGASAKFTRASATGLITQTHANIAYGAGDFTLEFWMYPEQTTYADWCGLYSTAPQSNPTPYGLDFRAIYTTVGQYAFYTYENWGVQQSAWSVGAVPATWCHVALVRASGVLKVYLDGAEVTKVTTGANENRNYTMNIGIVGQLYTNGALGSVGGNNSYIDELRVTKGVARYTAPFTPRTTPFPNSA